MQEQVTPILRDVPGLFWDVPFGILRTPSHTNLEGCPRTVTVLECPIWDLQDTKSHQYSGMSQDCPGMSPDTKSHQSSGTSKDCPGMSHVGSSGHQAIPILRDVPGQSWDVPHGIVQTSSYLSLEGCPRTVLGCPSWDCPDITSLQLGRMSQESSGMSFMGSSGHQLRLACRDVPGQSQISLIQASRDQVTPTWKDVPGQSWDVPRGILWTSCHPSLQGYPRTVLGCMISRIVLRCPGHL